MQRTPLWNLAQVQQGDLVVGIEGTAVWGICQAGRNATESYRFDASGYYNYAQIVCAPVEWREWDSARMGQLPHAPRQSGLGGQAAAKRGRAHNRSVGQTFRQ